MCSKAERWKDELVHLVVFALPGKYWTMTQTLGTLLVQVYQVLLFTNKEGGISFILSFIQ